MCNKSFLLSPSLVIPYEDFQFYSRPQMLLFSLLFLLSFSLLSSFNFVKRQKMLVHGDLDVLLNDLTLEYFTKTQDLSTYRVIKQMIPF